MEAAHDRPEDAWPVVVASIEAAAADETLFTIAAGPLEDLIGEHADFVIDVIEDAARYSPKLRRALSGVWARVLDSELAARLERVVDVDRPPH